MHGRTFMTQNGIWPTRQQADREREVSVAETGSVDLDEDFVWLHRVEFHLAQRKLALELWHYQGGRGAGHTESV